MLKTIVMLVASLVAIAISSIVLLGLISTMVLSVQNAEDIQSMNLAYAHDLVLFQQELAIARFGDLTTNEVEAMTDRELNSVLKSYGNMIDMRCCPTNELCIKSWLLNFALENELRDIRIEILEEQPDRAKSVLEDDVPRMRGPGCGVGQ